MRRILTFCKTCGAVKWWHTMTHCGYCGSELPKKENKHG